MGNRDSISIGSIGPRTKLTVFQQVTRGTNDYTNDSNQDFTIGPLTSIINRRVNNDNVVIFVPPEFVIKKGYVRLNEDPLPLRVEDLVIKGVVIAVGFRLEVGSYSLQYKDEGLQRESELKVFTTILREAFKIASIVAKNVKINIKG